jgi:hypothetical protein
MSVPDSTQFQLSPRDLLILLLTLIFGVGAGLLLWLSGVPVGEAIVAGFGAAGGTLVLLDKITKKM